MEDKIFAFNEGIPGSLTFDYMSDVNFAMVYNRRSAIVSCVIHNDSDHTWHDVCVDIRGEAVKPCSHTIESIAPHTSIDISREIAIEPDPNELMCMTEARPTSITVSVSMAADQTNKLSEEHCDNLDTGKTTVPHDRELLSITLPLRLMAYNQWLGIGEHPEMLAAFVMPNHPMLSPVIARASTYMQKWTGNSSMDEYQSGDNHRVRQQVAAIYEALRGEGIVYATPPASFETSGQRIRTVDKVLTERTATCLDLALLVASCLEGVGINPVIIVLKGHAMLGAWLEPATGPMIGDDASLLLKSAAEGISEIVLVETTLLASDREATFEDAVAAALTQLKDEDRLRCYINVAECRYNGIRPMAMRVLEGQSWTVVNDTPGPENDLTEVRRVDRYDLSAYDGAGKTVTKYTIWERKLLDFSLHNNLLNMKLGKKIIPLVSFGIDTLEDRLHDGKSFRVAPFPFDQPVAPTDGMYDSSRFPQLETPTTQQMANGVLLSFHNEDTLKEALKYAYRSSRTSLEENGANNLYMVIGVLKWIEDERRTKPLYAPLLLIPIEIIRGVRGAGYTIRTRDEETALNITLTEMLKQQHDIDLSVLDPLPTDQSGVDVKKILAVVRDKIRDKRGWNVIDEAMIGLFSFSKFVMWNDIHTNSELMHANPIISSLVEGRLMMDINEQQTDAKAVDREMRPEQLTIPIDVDSSQLEAIIDSGAGKSFILHGPPGTGKSQTITNMIANALYQGKRVLFVAEKMAALSVVQSRLEKIGLAPFCLELHSNKVTKQHFLRQMEMAMDVAHTATPKDYKTEADALYAKRLQLMDYIEALHTPQPCGLSLYDCITGYLSIPGDEIDVDIDSIPDLSVHKIELVRQSASRIDTLLQILGNPADNAYSGLTLKDGSAETETLIHTLTAECDRLLTELDNPALLRLCIDSAALKQLSDAIDAKLSTQQLQHQIAQRYGQGFLSVDLTALRREWEQASAKWFIPRYFARKKILKRHSLTAADIDWLINTEGTIRGNQSAAYPYDEQINRLFGSDIRTGRTRLDICQRVNDALQRIKTVADIEVTASRLPETMHRWAGGSKDMRNWYMWCRERSAMRDAHLMCVVNYLANSRKTGAEAAEAFAKGAYHAMATRIINQSETVRLFNGLMFDEVIDSYRRLTAEFQQLSKKELFCRLASRVPSLTMAAHDNSEVGILKRNIKNGGRGTSIRRIIDQIPTLLPKLSPCMLMSPLSVAQYIDLNNEKFDIVIFDEASQMPTSEAVGAIARGKALIVVGDPQQMPPTSFFATSAVGEDEAELDDMESILDDCLAMSIPSKHLTWHYRSKHESLIAFSNSQYYGGRLLTFPSVDDSQRKVTLRRIDGVYQRSGARVNLPEAEAVVREVVRRLSDPELARLSIGIVSFSKVQQDKIEDLLTDELSRHPELETRAYDGAEPIFIKNLENVQGDERDVILFSVGYGPDKNGNVSMNFGPLNKKGGERRLNVAVSRARYEMIVFSSMKSEHIDLRRTNAQGVEGLKKFLEFAEKGATSINAEVQVTDNGGCIPKMIADELRKHGYTANIGVGRSQMKVDVAVVDPKEPGRYMLGILMDGPSYYATKTVRDREVVQPSVLGMLNWRLMRVWTLDWYERRQQVIDRILARLKDIESHPHDEPSAPKASTKVAGDNMRAKEEAIKAQAERIEEDPPLIVPQNPAIPYTMAQNLVAARPVSSVDEMVPKGRTILSQLKGIVKAEQPITSTLLYKRIARLWELPRVSPKLQSLVDGLLSTSGLLSMPDGKRGKVWWTSTKDAEAFHGYRTGSDRDIQDVPYIEIENAMRFVIDQQIAISRDDLKRLTANQLGYTRKGTNIDIATEVALNALLTEGYVAANGDKISKN